MSPANVSDCQKNCIDTAALCNEIWRSNKFDLFYYVQVNSLRLKSSVGSKWTSKHLCNLFCFRWYNESCLEHSS